MILYSIKDWNERFENNRSRRIGKTTWVPIPNKHDGEGYLNLIDRKNGLAIYGAWILILQVASKCHPRGVLVRANGQPHDSASISRITRANREMIEAAIEVLASEDVGWLTVEISGDTARSTQESLERQAEVSPWREGDEEQNGIEQNGIERTEKIALKREKFAEFWSVYPKRNGKLLGKAECEKIFLQRTLEEIQAILFGVGNFCKSKKALDGYAEDPKRWLSHKRWMDWQDGPGEVIEKTSRFDEVSEKFLSMGKDKP